MFIFFLQWQIHKKKKQIRITENRNSPIFVNTIGEDPGQTEIIED
jgi:hypothetical protein